ncbi:MAG: alpha/beta fold hydrolase [Acidimicrobiia bacterium]|nr:alpha/beta fold hydrolase [Acidimicrobiia bacterium]
MKKSSLVKLAVATGAAGTAGAVVAAGRRWAANDDPDADTRLVVPDGDDVRVPTPDGGEIAGTDAGAAGDGRTFVLVHGWTNDRRIWAPVAGLLVERGHRVVLYDQRGHGASRAGRDGLTIEALGNDMAAVLEHLDIRDAIVAGHSMGGMAAQAFAIEHPDVLSERVAAVALVSTACSELAMPGPANRLAPLVLGSSLVSRFVSNSRLGPFLVRGTMGRKATLSNLKAMQDTFAATEPSARADFYRAMAAMDLSEGLADVDVPVLVISGVRDGLVAHKNSKRLADIINGARFEAIRDAGHMLPLELPGQVAGLRERLAQESTEHDRSLSAAAR